MTSSASQPNGTIPVFFKLMLSGRRLSAAFAADEERACMAANVNERIPLVSPEPAVGDEVLAFAKRDSEASVFSRR
jgi:hypothetical protein